MRKLIITEFMTLDGVIEAPDKWSIQYWNEAISNFKREEVFSADSFVLGRVTYDGFSKAWPTMEGTGDFGERMNSLPKYVASKTLKQEDMIWNANVMSDDVVEKINELKNQQGMNILVAGSPDFAQTLIKEKLVDEFWLLVYPVTLGQGKKLFQDGAETKLQLLETKDMGSGVVLIKYATIV